MSNASTTTKVNLTKVVTGPVRLSYAHVWEPASIQGGAEKYSTSIIVPKSDTATLEKINAAVEAAKSEGIKVFGGKIPARLKLPLRDGDEERPDDEAYKDSYFFNASSGTKPGIVDLNRKEISDEREVYSGCWCRVSVNFYAFNRNGNVGIAAGLNNIQKVRDDAHLGGRSSAQSDFNDDFLPEFDDDDDFLD